MTRPTGFGAVCEKHGQLARSCSGCDLDEAYERIRELEAENERLLHWAKCPHEGSYGKDGDDVWTCRDCGCPVDAPPNAWMNRAR